MKANIQILIDDKRVENLSDGAIETLKRQVNQYADEIIKEANIIEKDFREDGARSEITSNIILTAVKQRKPIIKKLTKLVIAGKITSTLTLPITGLLYDSTGYHNKTIKMVVFIILLIISCVSTVIGYNKE